MIALFATNMAEQANNKGLINNELIHKGSSCISLNAPFGGRATEGAALEWATWDEKPPSLSTSPGVEHFCRARMSCYVASLSWRSKLVS